MSREAVDRLAERIKKQSGVSSEKAHQKAREIAVSSEKTTKKREK